MNDDEVTTLISKIKSRPGDSSRLTNYIDKIRHPDKLNSNKKYIIIQARVCKEKENYATQSSQEGLCEGIL
jgi:hypothetical protein